MTDDEFDAALYELDPELRKVVMYVLNDNKRRGDQADARFVKLEKDQQMIRWSFAIIRWMQPILAAGLGVLLGRLLV